MLQERRYRRHGDLERIVLLELLERSAGRPQVTRPKTKGSFGWASSLFWGIREQRLTGFVVTCLQNQAAFQHVVT